MLVRLPRSLETPESFRTARSAISGMQTNARGIRGPTATEAPRLHLFQVRIVLRTFRSARLPWPIQETKIPGISAVAPIFLLILQRQTVDPASTNPASLQPAQGLANGSARPRR